MEQSLKLNTLRHVSPATLATLEDDLEKKAEKEYNALKREAEHDHHQLHATQNSHR